MKRQYIIKSESSDGLISDVFTSTRKRDIESFFNRLKRSFKRGGQSVQDIRLGYFRIIESGSEYWITAK